MTTPVTLEELQTAYDILDRFTDEHGSLKIHPEETAAAMEGMIDIMMAVNKHRGEGKDFQCFTSQLISIILLSPLRDYIEFKRKEN